MDSFRVLAEPAGVDHSDEFELWADEFIGAAGCNAGASVSVLGASVGAWSAACGTVPGDNCGTVVASIPGYGATPDAGTGPSYGTADESTLGETVVDGTQLMQGAVAGAAMVAAGAAG